ncbi:sensor histidine kinase [Streptomyces sp. AK010]|uniref:sensor histidine kinase n=1 Tax=Streptomyces sp. AK010 TaxID=2723074 RepID=UPI00161F907F|nr:histidine kinase [Streptomyces sp. AK010]
MKLPRRPGRARLLDVLCASASAMAALAWTVAAFESGEVTGDLLFWLMSLGIAGSALLWWRRAHPVRVAVALACCYAVTDFVFVAVLFAVGTVAAYRPRRVANTVAASCAVAYLPFSASHLQGTASLVAANGFNIAALVLAVGLGRFLGSRRDLVTSLQAEARAAEAAAQARTDRVRAMERERIAREMHDVLAHRISLVSLHAGALKIRTDLPPEEVARAADTIHHSAHQAMEDLRAILGMLRFGTDGQGLRPQPDLTDLPRLLAECRTAGMDVTVDDRLPDKPVSPNVGRTVYHVVQEGLTNCRKHAPGSPVDLLLERTDDGQLHVRLRNPLARSSDGPLLPGSHYGLVALAERLDVVGGRLEHGVRRDGVGKVAFHLEAWVPWSM